ncbi:probable endopeptidase K [Fusarium fujikuroi IMI 58289]|uniref:Probable endopeptidase K n=1 Tax=Gibberella fujikuroi (strain CBS 195.34 / IMI 58289 / NRRL A-6831) TaxID=1279085 RepID=S0E616_GIBF5|nr:probable endopeptidase K [Fusarium fujikuroi IMI 58289]KLP00860.1 putative endopeptidase K [Fusarium fujikuroi]CCT67998.1 probable endopeptidase K [Fusarium fujikuroi IMI 58289]SCN94000.1 probable endopeptidase K [Fusarium fujikuroi]SCO46910.1 probable endopeptidase K [Fusarium fujikuroi]
MKPALFLFSLAELVRLTLAQVKVQNANIEPELVVPDSYIIKYKPKVSSSSKKKHEEVIHKKAKSKGKEGIVENIDLDGFKGYVAEIPSSELREVIDSDLVDYIEQDTIVNVSAVAAPSSGPITKRGLASQASAPWGLARISQVYSKKGVDARYNYDSTAGSGSTVYVLDSGIRTTHKEFGGRALWGTNFVSGSPDTDELGHGTHVAGIVGGKTYGVAKGCRMYAVKVIDKDGLSSMSTTLQGLQWAVNHAKSRGITKKSIINASLGGPYTKIGNDAVKAATDLGITIVAAAGNDGSDAANYSPGSAPSAITVGAIDSSGYRTMWSNYGKVVDIFAPGSDILSAGHMSDSSSLYMSGTSMAAPHVAGLAAYFMAKEGLRGSSAVTKRIIGAADTSGVYYAFDSPQRVAYNGGGK